jgi:hypothetical protein
LLLLLRPAPTRAQAAASAERPETPREQGGTPEQPTTQAKDRDDAAVKPRADQARGYALPPGTEPEDVGLFLPRVVLFLPRMALKLVFWPITETIGFLDRHAVIETVEDVLYNDERTAGILPLVFFDTSFGPTVGIKAFHDDMAGHGEQGSIKARFGGRFEQAYQLGFRADRTAGSRLWLESLVRFEVEPGLLFQGIGNPDAASGGSGLGARQAAVMTRFRQQRLLSLIRSGYTIGEPGALTKLGATGILNSRQFSPNTRGSDPSTESVYDTATLVGYEQGVNMLELDANLVVDTRDVAGSTSSGLYLEAFGGAVPPLGDYRFWHYGVESTAYVNLYRKTRVLVLRAAIEGVEGPSANIPFSDLPRLGGPHRLRGYALDQLRDEKAALGTVEYHYPIHQYVAGSLHLDVGHVALDYAELFSDRDWKPGFGGGFIIRSRDHVLFTIDIAYGDGLHLYLTTDPLRAFAKRDTEL